MITPSADAERLTEPMPKWAGKLIRDRDAEIARLREHIKDVEAGFEAVERQCRERGRELDTATRRAEALEAEVGRLQDKMISSYGWGMKDGLSYAAAPPAADHTERAREFDVWLRRNGPYYTGARVLSELRVMDADNVSGNLQSDYIAEALTAAERAGAEKMRALDEAAIEAARNVVNAAYGMASEAEQIARRKSLLDALAARDAATDGNRGGNER